jgi:predicted TIM-barrel fold metal-dependent hydrolase
MGEVGTQYVGMAFDDPRMTPFYELAEELDIPVGMHASGGPPLTAERCCPDFRLSIGDPALLEEVLVQYPRLRVFIMHANVLTYPALLRMLQQFPHVYVDLTVFSTILPREGFHQMLLAYKHHGLLSRIMFGTDDFPVDKTIEAYSSADFLTEEELQGILCGNAERYLRMEGVCQAL